MSALSARAMAACCSTKTTVEAPRESDSSPSAPLPANRSRQRAPTMRGPSQLNSVSRTRSGVGRTSGMSGKRQRRPRIAPPMTRMTRDCAPRPCDCSPRSCGDGCGARLRDSLCCVTAREPLLDFPARTKTCGASPACDGCRHKRTLPRHYYKHGASFATGAHGRSSHIEEAAGL